MSIRPQFSGHETFALRAGWPKKAVDAAAEDPAVFSGDAAIARFGVGTNRVRSVRHRALATGLLEETSRGMVTPGVVGAEGRLVVA